MYLFSSLNEKESQCWDEFIAMCRDWENVVFLWFYIDGNVCGCCHREVCLKTLRVGWLKKKWEASTQSHWRIGRIHWRVAIEEFRKKRKKEKRKSVWHYANEAYIICVYMTVCFQLSLPFCCDILQGFVTEIHKGKKITLYKQVHMFREEFSIFALIKQT